MMMKRTVSQAMTSRKAESRQAHRRITKNIETVEQPRGRAGARCSTLRGQRAKDKYHLVKDRKKDIKISQGKENKERGRAGERKRTTLDDRRRWRPRGMAH